MSWRENVWFLICDQDQDQDHKFIENSDIVEASLALVDSPQWNVRLVFQGGLRLLSRI